MKIRVEKTDVKQIYRYAELASDEVIERAGYGKYVTVVAFVYEDGFERAAGLVQYITEKSKARLLWIYVYREYRKQGVGKELVKFMADNALKEGAAACVMNFCDFMVEDIGADEAIAFIEKTGFMQHKACEGIFCLTGKDILTKLDDNYYESVERVTKNAVFFSECTPMMMVEMAKKLKPENSEDVLKADRNVSFFYESSNGVSGLVQCEREGRTICVRCLIAKDEGTMKKILAVFLETIFRKMRFNERVVWPENEMGRKILKKMFPGIKGQRSLEFMIQMKGVV